MKQTPIDPRPIKRARLERAKYRFAVEMFAKAYYVTIKAIDVGDTVWVRFHRSEYPHVVEALERLMEAIELNGGEVVR